MASNEVSVRLAMPDDAWSLSALGTQVFLDTYASSGVRQPVARDALRQFDLAATQALLAKPASSILLAERSDHLVAFAQVVYPASHELLGSTSVAELARLYVQRPFQRAGLGRSLLRESEQLAQGLGASKLWLTAWVGNARALAFYASQGYRELGATPYVFEGEAFENRLFAKDLDLGA